MTDRDDDFPPTEADLTSQTRFGPRHSPKGHRVTSQRLESRRIPPHGDVSPDGRKIWPTPSLTTKILVWGGTGIAVAAATAGTVMAARHVADMVAGPATPKRPPAPGPRPEVQRSAPAPDYVQAEPRPRRAKAKRKPLMDEIQDNTHRLSVSASDVVGALGALLTGFRLVAENGGDIVRQFSDTANSIRSFLDREPATEKHRDAAEAPDSAADPRTHRL